MSHSAPTEPAIAEDKITVTAQLPMTLVEELRLIAKREGRSLSSQVRLFLGEAVTRQNTDHKQAA